MAFYDVYARLCLGDFLGFGLRVFCMNSRMDSGRGEEIPRDARACLADEWVGWGKYLGYDI